jgi:hypothetical protein
MLEFWSTPVGAAAAVSGIIAITSVVLNLATTIFLHRRRLGADMALADRRGNADVALAERKFLLDATLADRKRRQDLAEEVLSGFYEMGHILRSIRSPASLGGEAKGRVKPDGESEQVGKVRDTYFVIVARFDANRRPISDLLARRYRMTAWFGREAEQPFQQLNEALNRVINSAQLLVSWAGTEIKPETWQRMEEDVWEGYGDPDVIRQKVDAAIAEAEAICRPALEGPSLPVVAVRVM